MKLKRQPLGYSTIEALAIDLYWLTGKNKRPWVTADKRTRTKYRKIVQHLFDLAFERTERSRRTAADNLRLMIEKRGNHGGQPVEQPAPGPGDTPGTAG